MDLLKLLRLFVKAVYFYKSQCSSSAPYCSDSKNLQKFPVVSVWVRAWCEMDVVWEKPFHKTSALTHSMRVLVMLLNIVFHFSKELGSWKLQFKMPTSKCWSGLDLKICYNPYPHRGFVLLLMLSFSLSEEMHSPIGDCVGGEHKKANSKQQVRHCYPDKKTWH